MKTCYIIGAGNCSVKPKPSEGDLVIAADGGYDTLYNFGMKPDLLVGDLDSIDAVPRGVEIIRHPIKKDETDMHLAYLEGVRRGYEYFKIFGGTGGRSDHTFANYCLLMYIRDNGGRAELIDDLGGAFVIKNESITIGGRPGRHLSVFAIGGGARGVSIVGAEYEARDVTLSPAFPLGVSNSFREEPVRIEVRDGYLLVMIEK